MLWMYGKYRAGRYRTLICRAKFLNGGDVRVVWSRFENDKGLTEKRIFISTNTEHEGLDVLRGYAKRWPVELSLCFNNSNMHLAVVICGSKH